MSTIAPNWYRDPVDEKLWRYWDGTAWTENTSIRQVPQSFDGDDIVVVEKPVYTKKKRLFTAGPAIASVVLEAAMVLFFFWSYRLVDTNGVLARNDAITDPTWMAFNAFWITGLLSPVAAFTGIFFSARQPRRLSTLIVNSILLALTLIVAVLVMIGAIYVMVNVETLD